jgi:hypothetical protein
MFTGKRASIVLTLFFLIPTPWVGMGLIVGRDPQTIVGT